MIYMNTAGIADRNHVNQKKQTDISKRENDFRNI